jgi:dipeptidyl aminopeptidase/acylaminoacyl peptidase
VTPDDFLDALLTLPTLETPKVSPDGRWVAWTWYRTGPAADVYAAPTDGSAAPVRLTETPHDTLPVSWTPDSCALLVAQDRDGDERVQLFRVDLARPGVMQPLTEPRPDYYLNGGEMHPNGAWLVYSANLDVASGQEIEPSWLYRHDLETGERRPLARPQRSCYTTPSLNQQGTHVLYQRNDPHPAGLQLWMVDIEGRDDREILNVGADKKADGWWFPDGRRVLALAETDTHQRVGVWDGGSVRWMVDDPSRGLESARVPARGRQAVLVEARQARNRASLLDLETGDEVPLPPFGETLLPIAPAGDGRWVGEYYSSRQPADLVRFSPDDLRPETFVSLTRIWDRTAITPADLTPGEDFRWRSADGRGIQGWLYRPRGEARGTVVHVHGGPTWHIEDWVDAETQFMVARGFNVLLPNYRGSTGFGLPFREAIKQDGWGGREQEDIASGIQALIDAGIARPGQVGVTGTSYGGYSSWCAITRYPPGLVAAAAPICGMTDLAVDHQTTRPDLRPFSEEMMGGSPQEVPDRYRERSPIHFVSNIRGRLLIVQGAQDPNVTPENVRVVLPALTKAGIPYELLTFEDEGHGITRPKNERTLYLRLADFFESAFAGPTA